jgi:hypothetical protein
MTSLRPGMKIDVTVTATTVPAGAAAGDGYFIPDGGRAEPAVRPDNSYVRFADTAGRMRCHQHDGGHSCLALMGHAGEHRGYGSGGVIYHRWRNDDDGARPGNEFEPSGRLHCMNEEPAGGYICTARKGHTGKHMGWWATGERDPDATW